MPDFDAARGDDGVARRRLGRRIALVLGRRVARRPIVDDALKVAAIVDAFRRGLVQEIGMAVHGGFAGLGQNDEFVAHVAADRAAIGAHRDCFQP